MSEKIRNLRRSLNQNVETPIRLVGTRGEVPMWLNGTLFRNGPGRYAFPNNKVYEHMFDGQACIQKFKIERGQVFYTNKLLETTSYKKTLRNNCLYPNFGSNEEMPGRRHCLTRLLKFMRQPETNDNVNINLVPFANDKLYALTETNRFCQIDPNTLEIIDTINIKEHCSSIMTTIAHPHIEKDGTNL